MERAEVPGSRGPAAEAEAQMSSKAQKSSEAQKKGTRGRVPFRTSSTLTPKGCDEGGENLVATTSFDARVRLPARRTDISRGADIERGVASPGELRVRAALLGW